MGRKKRRGRNIEGDGAEGDRVGRVFCAAIDTSIGDRRGVADSSDRWVFVHRFVSRLPPAKQTKTMPARRAMRVMPFSTDGRAGRAGNGTSRTQFLALRGPLPICCSRWLSPPSLTVRKWRWPLLDPASTRYLPAGTAGGGGGGGFAMSHTLPTPTPTTAAVTAATSVAAAAVVVVECRGGGGGLERPKNQKKPERGMAVSIWKWWSPNRPMKRPTVARLEESETISCRGRNFFFSLLLSRRKEIERRKKKRRRRRRRWALLSLSLCLQSSIRRRR